MKKVQKGFTLVELIVVITILAILGTIAFISLQGYSQDAKNSKVTSDVRTLTSAIETSMTDGTVGNITAAITGGTGSGASGVAGSGTISLPNPTAGSGSYAVGTVNFTAIRQNGADFTYTVNGITAAQNYLMGGVQVLPNPTLSKGAQMYQIAGAIIQGGNSVPVVKGNYVKYGTADVAGLISDTNVSPAGTPLLNGSATTMSGSTLY